MAITTQELDLRQAGVRAAVANARLAGIDLSDDTRAIMDCYAAGRIDGDEMMDRVLALYGAGATDRSGERLEADRGSD